jgi:hypothetical protein
LQKIAFDPVGRIHVLVLFGYTGDALYYIDEVSRCREDISDKDLLNLIYVSTVIVQRFCEWLNFPNQRDPKDDENLKLKVVQSLKTVILLILTHGDMLTRGDQVVLVRDCTEIQKYFGEEPDFNVVRNMLCILRIWMCLEDRNMDGVMTILAKNEGVLPLAEQQNEKCQEWVREPLIQSSTFVSTTVLRLVGIFAANGDQNKSEIVALIGFASKLNMTVEGNVTWARYVKTAGGL